MAGEHNVGRFDVAMNDAFAVGVIQSLRYLLKDDGKGRTIENSRLMFAGGGDGIFEGWTVDELHDDVGGGGTVYDVVDHDDTGMRKSTGEASFAQNAFVHTIAFRRWEVADGDSFDGDRTANGGV